MTSTYLRQLREIREALGGRSGVDPSMVEALRCLDFNSLVWIDNVLDAAGGDLASISPSDLTVLAALTAAARALHSYREAGGEVPQQESSKGRA